MLVTHPPTLLHARTGRTLSHPGSVVRDFSFSSQLDPAAPGGPAFVLRRAPPPGTAGPSFARKARLAVVGPAHPLNREASFATRSPPRGKTFEKPRNCGSCRRRNRDGGRQTPCKSGTFNSCASWIAPRRSGVRVPTSSLGNSLHVGGFSASRAGYRPSPAVALVKSWSSGPADPRFAGREAQRGVVLVAGGRRIMVLSSSGVSRPANALCAMQARMSAEWRASSKNLAGGDPALDAYPPNPLLHRAASSCRVS